MIRTAQCPWHPHDPTAGSQQPVRGHGRGGKCRPGLITVVADAQALGIRRQKGPGPSGLPLPPGRGKPPPVRQAHVTEALPAPENSAGVTETGCAPGRPRWAAAAEVQREGEEGRVAARRVEEQDAGAVALAQRGAGLTP